MDELWFFQIKKSKTVLKAIREYLKITGKLTILQTDNGGEFNNELLKNFLEHNNIQYVRGSLYNQKRQGAVESLNRTIQNILYLAKDMQGSEFELNDPVYDFIIKYNNRIHTSIKFKPQEVFQNIMNEDMKKKVQENIIKLRKEAKVTQYVVDQIVRISSHFKISRDEKIWILLQARNTF